jgi:hypothetical protein
MIGAHRDCTPWTPLAQPPKFTHSLTRFSSQRRPHRFFTCNPNECAQRQSPLCSAFLLIACD